MAQALARDERQTVVLGDRTYAVHRDWAQWPPNVPQGFLSEVAVGSDGRVFALQRGATPVVVFNPDGSFSEAWGDGIIADGHGIWASAMAVFTSTASPLMANCCQLGEQPVRRRQNSRRPMRPGR